MFPDSVKHIYYRGPLRSCNYSCSYCPFARCRATVAEVEKDRKHFADFYDKIKQSISVRRIMVIPYGEALIHNYYREGMIRLSQLPHVAGIGCQTNLSFSPAQFISTLVRYRANAAKIKLWASFHPEMVAMDDFLEKVHYLRKHQVEICVGVVGDPSKRDVIKELRQRLSPDLYLFINAMQGLGRKLTVAESDFFSSIDNFFTYDLHNAKADFQQCNGGRSTIFADEHGDVFACPRSRIRIKHFPDKKDINEYSFCKRQVCDCYIAYSNLIHSPLQRMMGDGVLWRIPEKQPVRAIFFDIDGTLTDHLGNIPQSYTDTLTWLSGRIALYLATALPVEYAKATLGTLFALFKGGVFADGAHLRLGTADTYVPVLHTPDLDNNTRSKTTVYRTPDGQVFKYAITLPSAAIAASLYKRLDTGHYNLFREKRLLTIVDRQAGKANGVKRMCEKLGIAPVDVLAVGNSVHDAPMLAMAGYSCAVLTADEALKKQAGYLLNPDRLAPFLM